MSFEYVPLSSSKVAKDHTFDVGVLIALPEELNSFLEAIKSSDSNFCSMQSLVSFWDHDTNFTKFDLTFEDQVIQVVVALVNEMGNEYSALVTKIMVDRWNLPFIVNIGLTGSLDPDLKIGSVLVPSQITQYTANWKAKDNKNNDNTEFVLGTRAFATSRLILSQFSSFQCSADYKKWQDECMVRLGDNRCYSKPDMVTGHLASGNMVVDSEHFKINLKETDRKLMGCEMEAAGFSIAEQFLQSAARASSQFICLRCISDMAANKSDSEVDGIRMPPPRQWAMSNATVLFVCLLRSRVIDTNTDAQIERIEQLRKGLQDRKASAKKRPLQSSNTNIRTRIDGIKWKYEVRALQIGSLHEILQYYDRKYDFTDQEKTLQDAVIEELINDGKIKSKPAVSERAPTRNNERSNKRPRNERTEMDSINETTKSTVSSNPVMVIDQHTVKTGCLEEASARNQFSENEVSSRDERSKISPPNERTETNSIDETIIVDDLIRKMEICIDKLRKLREKEGKNMIQQNYLKELDVNIESLMKDITALA